MPLGTSACSHTEVALAIQAPLGHTAQRGRRIVVAVVFRQPASALSSLAIASVTSRSAKRVTTALPCRCKKKNSSPCPDFRLEHRQRSRAASTWATLPVQRTRCSLQRGENHPAHPLDLPRLVTRIELVVRSLVRVARTDCVHGLASPTFS